MATMTGAGLDFGEAMADDATFAEVMARAGSADFDEWERQVHRAGCCLNPVRLYGTIHHGHELVLDTTTMPDRVLLKACGNRRPSVCPACSWIYRGDTWQMLNAGMVGGKGVPDTIATHPAAFVTLTAPSFGAVHGIRDGKRRCHQADGQICKHGQPKWCRARHRDDDDELGQPLCADCYDHNAHVLFNWKAGELWRRFTIYLRRHLARQLGMTATQFRQTVRVSYAKVAEFQRRAVVHFHAIVRLDDATPDGEHLPPSMPIEFADLDAAVRSAAAKVTVPAPETNHRDVTLRFGTQVDVRAVNTGLPGELTGRAVAAYVSKYATKAAEDHGLGVDDRKVNPHGARLLATGRRLAATVDELADMARWEHMLFYGGHFSTKSRRYSVTLGSLRQARADYQRRADREARGLDPDQDDDEDLVVTTNLAYVGQGFTTHGDALLAASIAARSREHRELAREAARTC